jgi:NADH-quinone oxidoreductase subunit J
MIALFYLAAAFTLLTTALAITRANPVHALLYFVLSLLGMGVIFFDLGAPFAAALEVIVYAGAIMVLFLFVIMMLSLDKSAIRREREWLARPIWVAPILLASLLGLELARVLLHGGGQVEPRSISPQAVGVRLFTQDLAAVELASMLLLAGLVGAFHLGRKTP